MSNVIGPFLMKPTSQSMGFWICGKTLSEKLELKIFHGTVEVDSVPFTELQSSQYGVRTAESFKLSPGLVYTYKILEDGKLNYFGLGDSDFLFKTVNESDGRELQFVAISCNGIEEFEHHNKTGNAWAMWERLLAECEKNNDLSFCLLAGDQVYMDDEFEKDKKFISKSPDEIRTRILKVYSKYWGNIAYRKIMARVPSFLMWDDHDLIDGFGSRPEQFSKKGVETEDWVEYRKYLTEAFYEFQASRNPGNFSKTGPFSFSLEMKKSGFVVMDLRSQRNAVLKEMLNSEHKKIIEGQIDSLLQRNVGSVFIVTPVTLARMGGKIEQILGHVSNYLWNLTHNISNTIKWRTVLWTVLASLALASVQVRLNGQAAHFASLLGGFLCLAYVMLDVISSKNFLSKKATWSLRGLTGLYGVSILTYAFFVWDWSIFTNVDWSKTFRDLRELELKVLPALWLSVIGLYFLQALKMSDKAKKVISIVTLVVVLIFFAGVNWIGLPGKGSALGYWVIPLWVMHIAGILFYMLALLEACGALDTIAGLDDDIKDSWSSEANRNELEWLRKQIRKVKAAGKRVVIIAGDIHTGGVSKISFDNKFQNEGDTVYQIVSSPIAYVPMGYLVEKFTSGNSVNKISEGDESLYSYNLFYRCERNFTIISTAPGKGVKSEFHFEDVGLKETISIK